MQFVNTSSKSVYSSFVGNVPMGKTTSGRSQPERQLELVLDKIVKACGDKLAIKLSAREAELVGRLMDLDERGTKFDPRSVTPRASVKVDYQKQHMDRIAKANSEALARESEINGETASLRTPVGPGVMKGEAVTPQHLKTGFEKIMEENARIAAGKDKKEMDPDEALDPIGAHMKGVAPDPAVQDEPKAPGKDAQPVVQSMHGKDDITRSADTSIPKPMAPGRQNQMDRKAAEMAGKLSILGAVDNAPVAKDVSVAKDNVVQKGADPNATKSKAKDKAKDKAKGKAKGKAK